ncbi:Methyltransferase type 11 [Methylobacterium sp. 4-46]|uniref:class I SAM-dependent methyltransferase n=1 Tax=unclassified Methylobacterium TaxID=2615210 RepID=UPI000152C183|nr:MULTISPECIES: class I SAM-dependent methyltransferase [Methylobacterium]ACA20688.1 Methyltransferase type 11 [Methylobacterium sp. 4-46]WFT79846.1 class I SAM-dependent methyltransferase [Methylobacterium nodulans]
MPGSWQTRQVEMEGWYATLAIDQDTAVEALNRDYQPYAHILTNIKGLVLDIGGGAGLAGAYMDPDTEYIVIDPSLSWTTERWAAIRRRLSPHRTEFNFVLGTGENLPFPSQSFDAALAFWSLNHASNPGQCIAEIHRILKPCGRALLVLEDMEPAWIDILQLVRQALMRKLGRPVRNPLNWGSAKDVIWRKLSGQPWPLQSDHQRIVERELVHWLHGQFRVVNRSWIGGFLSYELEA